MAATRPESLTITYPGGASATIPFDDLPATLRNEILRQPFAATPGPDPAAESYVLLEWEDGWKEVVQVDAGCTGIRRYYVISRTEEVGRLSMEHESGYPVLLEVERRPGGLSRVTFGETFTLSPERSAREGKKTDTWYSLAKSGERGLGFRLGGILLRFSAGLYSCDRDQVLRDHAPSNESLEA